MGVTHKLRIGNTPPCFKAVRVGGKKTLNIVSSQTQNSWYSTEVNAPQILQTDRSWPIHISSTWKFWDLWVKSCEISSGEPQVKLHDLLMAIFIPQKSVENLVVSRHLLVNGGLHHPRWDGHHPAAYSLDELDGYAKLVGDHVISCSQYLNRTIWQLWQYVGYAEGISNFRDPNSPNISCPAWECWTGRDFSVARTPDPAEPRGIKATATKSA